MLRRQAATPAQAQQFRSASNGRCKSVMICLEDVTNQFESSSFFRNSVIQIKPDWKTL